MPILYPSRQRPENSTCALLPGQEVARQGPIPACLHGLSSFPHTLRCTGKCTDEWSVSECTCTHTHTYLTCKKVVSLRARGPRPVEKLTLRGSFFSGYLCKAVWIHDFVNIRIEIACLTLLGFFTRSVSPGLLGPTNLF